MLTGPRQRINRANRQIIALQRSFQGFFRDHLYEIGVAEYNRKADHYSLRVLAGPEEFPVNWSLCIGEIVHNLRSALDNLTWQHALDWQFKTGGDPYSRTAFPIFLRGTTEIRRKGGKIPHFACDGQRLLQSVDPKLWARFELFQPYKRGNGYRSSSLHRLEEMNNTDKHRLLTVLAPGLSSYQFSGMVGEAHFKRRVNLHVGTKIGWVRDVPPNVPGQGGIYMLDLSGWKPGGRLMEGVKLVEPKMEVNINVGPYVRFGHTCKAVERLPVIPALQGIANEVSRVVESFA